MALPLVLAGPILRRVEPNLVSVWLALRDASNVKLALWENQIKASDAQDSNIWFRSPDPVKTVRIGDRLHLVVVTLRLPSNKTLVPERLYSYDVEITPLSQTTKQTLKSLGLLANDPPNANPDGNNVKHLALGFQPDLLPCVVLPPNKLTDLRIVHGSCRDIDTSFPDALAYLDDLFTKDEAYKSALKRPHQVFHTGDQIYADEVPRPLIAMLNATARQLIGNTVEHLPFRDESTPPQVVTAPVDLVNFPAGSRHNILVNEAGMTTNDGASHLMSFGEFCAMYLYAWSNVCWEDQLANPPARTSLPPQGAANQITSPVLKKHLTRNAAGEEVPFPEYPQESYDTDIAQLVEFHRTLPKVRRALANVPSYMIFDDHEVTDDWFMTQVWRDRALSSPLGSAIIRNGMLAYALFQGWGNDPVKYEPRAGSTEKQPHEELLELAARFFPVGAATAPDITTAGNAAGKIDELLGLTLRNQVSSDGSYAETDPKLKWFYTVPGTKHHTIVLDCRTRRSFVSRISPPGNIGKQALKEQIPDLPSPSGKEVWFIVSSLPVLGPPIFDELLAPLLVKAFDAKGADALQKNRGTRRMPGTHPDAVEAWCFDPVLFETLIKRLKAYSPVVVLSGDVHYSASNAMNYWTNGSQQPSRIVQFISSGLKNVMPELVQKADRSFAILQKLTMADIGAERLGWESNSPVPVQVPANSEISPRLRGMLHKSPVLIPTIGWRGATATEADWSWRVTPFRDIREEKDRPKMARAFTLWPDDNSKKDDDIIETNVDGYHRASERHFRQLDRLNNCRQILFSSNIGLITFQNRIEKDNDLHDVEITYAIQDLYSAKKDPEELNARPKPEVFTRHEVPLKDVWQKPPKIKSN